MQSVVLLIFNFSQELERLQVEYEHARLALIEKEEELYRCHEANRIEFEKKQQHLEDLRKKHEDEKAEAWKEIEQEKTELEELRAKCK